MIKPVKIPKRRKSLKPASTRASHALSEKHHRKAVNMLLTESSIAKDTDFDAFEERYVLGLGGQLATLIDNLQFKPCPVTVRTTQGYETIFQTPKGGYVANLGKGTVEPADLDTPDMLAVTCMVYAYETNKTKLRSVNDLEVEHSFTDMCLALISTGRRTMTISDLDGAL